MFSINGWSLNSIPVDGMGDEYMMRSSARVRERLLQSLFHVHAEGAVAVVANLVTKPITQKKYPVNKDQILQQYLKRMKARQEEDEEDELEQLEEEMYEDRIISLVVTYQGIEHRIDAVITSRPDEELFTVVRINTNTLDVDPDITITNFRTSWK